ncbi:MAG: TfoX/Sxy family protein [Imperialibacter sp.]|uniref:TfoX/Sxy family protein n=1 Tax=Imperialibacter sp. TaxID=2038411 RepID=UPI0032EADC7E
MAYSDHQADRIRRRLSKANITEEKKMMGGLIFMVNHKMCVGIDIDKSTGLDRLMVRVGKASHEQLIFKHGSREMDFTGSVMRGFLFVGPEGFDKEVDLDFWITKALAFNTLETI